MGPCKDVIRFSRPRRSSVTVATHRPNLTGGMARSVLRTPFFLLIHSAVCEHSASTAFEAHSDLAAVHRSDERLQSGTH